MKLNRLAKTLLTTGLPFGLSMGVFFALGQEKFHGGVIVSGIFSGLFFGVFMWLFTEAQRKRMEIKGAHFEAHPLLFQGPASHFLSVEARGGWLILTPREVVFRSHGKNLQNSDLRIDLNDLREVQVKNTLGIIPNGLRLEKVSGGHESFIVNERSTWVEHIKAAIAAPRT